MSKTLRTYPKIIFKCFFGGFTAKKTLKNNFRIDTKAGMPNGHAMEIIIITGAAGSCG
jgi:hypothetical protein